MLLVFIVAKFIFLVVVKVLNSATNIKTWNGILLPLLLYIKCLLDYLLSFIKTAPNLCLWHITLYVNSFQWQFIVVLWSNSVGILRNWTFLCDILRYCTIIQHYIVLKLYEAFEKLTLSIETHKIGTWSYVIACSRCLL